MWEPQRLRALWAFTACYRDSFTLPLYGARYKVYGRTTELYFTCKTFKSFYNLELWTTFEICNKCKSNFLLLSRLWGWSEGTKTCKATLICSICLWFCSLFVGTWQRFQFLNPIYGGTLYRSWLRHYATSRKVVGSSPDEVDFFFNRPNPSSRTMIVGSTQPLTEMSTRNLPVG
jgi:hypothetical protein